MPFLLNLNYFLVEHCIYNFIHMSGVRVGQERCHSKRTILELYIRSQRGHLFRFIEYRHWMAPFLFWFNICSTYTGSFLDIVIIVTGWAFIMRFNQIADRLQLLEGHVRMYNVLIAVYNGWHHAPHLFICPSSINNFRKL